MNRWTSAFSGRFFGKLQGNLKMFNMSLFIIWLLFSLFQIIWSLCCLDQLAFKKCLHAHFLTICLDQKYKKKKETEKRDRDVLDGEKGSRGMYYSELYLKLPFLVVMVVSVLTLLLNWTVFIWFVLGYFCGFWKQRLVSAQSWVFLTISSYDLWLEGSDSVHPSLMTWICKAK